MFIGHGDIGKGGAANRYDRTSFFHRQGASLSIYPLVVGLQYPGPRSRNQVLCCSWGLGEVVHQRLHGPRNWISNTRTLASYSTQGSYFDLAVPSKRYLLTFALLQSNFARVLQIDFIRRHSSLVWFPDWHECHCPSGSGNLTNSSLVQRPMPLPWIFVMVNVALPQSNTSLPFSRLVDFCIFIFTVLATNIMWFNHLMIGKPLATKTDELLLLLQEGVISTAKQICCQRCKRIQYFLKTQKSTVPEICNMVL